MCETYNAKENRSIYRSIVYRFSYFHFFFVRSCWSAFDVSVSLALDLHGSHAPRVCGIRSFSHYVWAKCKCFIWLRKCQLHTSNIRDCVHGNTHPHTQHSHIYLLSRRIFRPSLLVLMLFVFFFFFQTRVHSICFLSFVFGSFIRQAQVPPALSWMRYYIIRIRIRGYTLNSMLAGLQNVLCMRCDIYMYMHESKVCAWWMWESNEITYIFSLFSFFSVVIFSSSSTSSSFTLCTVQVCRRKKIRDDVK